uniref:Fertilization-related kinase 1 n=1 Tax=Solanum chacoense TaxID=4108 RepID=T2B355_SOLCH|nr:fertilization-related kinase 1 [Solanum chacoense]
MEKNQEAEIMWKRGRTLGQGGFGFVSLACTTHSDDSPLIPSLIAVKSCMLSHSESLEDEIEFLRMCQDCPHVIRSFGVKVTQEDDILLYNLLLEYASAGSLADRLLNNDQLGLPEFQVQKHTKNVLLGLRFIHRKGIIHCDIKPHNILLTSTDDDDAEEVAKIADFGLSLTLEQSWTQKQGMRGTKRYMAPESLLKQEYGPEADIWALGCTVYELITGTPLWESSNSDPEFDDVLHRIMYEEPNLENDKLSTEAKDFMSYCLIKNPKSRWSAGLLLNHSFLKSADSVLPPKKRKRQHGYMSRLQRRKKAFRTQPHIRHLVIDL